MWVVIIMCAGMLVGYFCRNIHFISKHIESWVMWVIYLLLFLLGLSIANNPEIIKNSSRIGWQALIISIFAIAGSVLFVWAFAKWIYSGKEKHMNRPKKTIPDEKSI